ncbi:DUF6531 domain-containing protein [Geoalkalibacter subterraneus]|uniref:DUF6531 domain-containing protein n=1 Tax=Geoalkalibacter subterraneus TaxID=483547 RepID=UPI000AF202F1|nr:DUF6531 domain-containing protein [Geoalkalibacter subterraneus]
MKLTATGGGAENSDQEEIWVDEIRPQDWPRDTCKLAALGESTFNVMTGNIAHDQMLFSAKGGPLATSLSLYYNSLDRLDGSLGPGWGHSYAIRLHANSDGSMVLTDAAQKRFYYSDGASGYTTRKGDFSSLVKNGDGSYQLDFRDGQTYEFDTNGRLSAMTDRFGNTLSLSHSADQTTIIDPAGRTTVISYDSNERITSITDPAQNVYTFEYHADSGMLWKVHYPAADAGSVNGTWEYLYDAAGFMQYKIDPEGQIVKYTYDDQHRVASSIDPEGVFDTAGNESPEGHSKALYYDYPSPGQTTFIEKDGGQWVYSYDEAEGVLLAKQDPDGNAIRYVYNAEGLLYEKIAPVDADTDYVTTYASYDAYGNPLEITGHARHTDGTNDPADSHLQYTYDTQNFDRVTSITNLMDDPDTVTTFAYATDPDGSEVVTVTDPAGNQSVTHLNAKGAVAQLVDGEGRTTSYAYHPDGTLASVTSPEGVVTELSNYTELGLPQTIRSVGTDQSAQTTTLSYDALARVVSTTQAASPSSTTVYGYDLMGNRVSVTDAENRTTTFDHNYKGQVTNITDALSQKTALAYSGAGCPSCGGNGVDKLIALTDAKNQTTSFRYDPNGNLKSETDPLGHTILYVYTAGGALEKKLRDTNGDGEVDGGDELLVSYHYANNGRLVGKTDHVTGETTTFSYDPNGRLQAAINPAIGYTLEYYANGWLEKVTDSNGRVISYDQYNGAGQKTQITYLPGTVDEKTLGYGYDTAGRLETIASAAGTFFFGYDARSRRSTLSYPNGVVAVYGYAPDRDWLAGLDYQGSGGTLLSIAYPSHDLLGNRLQKTRDGVPTSYGYDDIYQLVSAGAEAYSFDPVGNRTAGPAGSESYSHDAANRMSAGRDGSYQYDERGNQTVRNVTDGTWALAWNGENQLIEASKPGTTVTFKYDPFGRFWANMPQKHFGPKF